MGIGRGRQYNSVEEFSKVIFGFGYGGINEDEEFGLFKQRLARLTLPENFRKNKVYHPDKALCLKCGYALHRYHKGEYCYLHQNG